MDKHLRRSRQHRVIAGVCGGIAEYFSIDPIVVRIIWIILSIAYFPAAIAYIIAAVIMPDSKADNTANGGNWKENSGAESDYQFNKEEWKEPPKYDPEKSKNILGVIFIIIGVLLLGKSLFNWLDLKVIMPLILIVIGAYIIYKGGKRAV